ncbi:MAG: 50S ribosomal protein L18e [Nanoarchaeota archaeon]
MKSKTLIEKQVKRKNDKELVETIIAAKKNKNWFRVAEILSSPRRKRININLNEIEKNIDGKNLIVIPGKVLSQGEITKKSKIVAFKFSEKAKEKLIKAGCEVKSIVDEIKNNPSAEGIKIINNLKVTR